ncbi:MAG TPA: hypothetical protein VHH09_05680 [Acidimicrobiales bacterium]|nr:hypothetical protein [Acidimicrobiales bacterium]
MTAQQKRDLRTLEGRTVHVALADGSRMDEVALVSARRTTLWIFGGGEDLFVPVERVVDVWESRSVRSPASL